jgi:DNA adenine methylase
VTIKPPFPYFGGKQTLGDRIIRLLPEHRHYVEPYGGSLSLLLAKPRVRFETVNDLDGDLMHFWRVLRTRPDELESACGLTPHSRAEHDAAKEAHKQQPVADEVERARQTWVQLTQGRSGKPIVERLHGVSLECRPALEVVERYGAHSEVLLMVDPPYVRSTRAGVGYRHEMDDDDHRELAKMLHGCASTVVLCGYPSNLYDEELFPDWNRLALPASTGNGGEWRDRTEVLWSNRPLGQQMDLFDLDEVGGAA